MENMLDSGSGDLAEHHIVHADEVDQTGADIATPPEERLMRDFEEALKLNRQRKHEDEDLSQVPQRQRSPELRRDNAAAPPPPMKPPPPAPVQQAPDTPNEMLSLAELRRYMRERPNLDQPAYAFEYADSQAFPEELDEWFQYAEPDCLMLLGSKASFEQRWEAYATSVDITSTWINTDDGHRSGFVKQSLEGIEEDDLFSRVEALEAICYLVCGAWRLTAGRPSPNYPSESEMTSKELAEWPMSKSLQIDWIVKNVSHIQAMGGISRLYDCFKKIISNEENILSTSGLVFENESSSIAYYSTREREINLILTIFYVIVEVGRRQAASGIEETALRDEIAKLEPNIIVFLLQSIARLRWEEQSYLPLQRLILLLWKSILLLWGGTDTLARVKADLEPETNPAGEQRSNRPVLTASPLDYHHFRQEVTSKYPAYNPPPPLVPFDLDTNSILPPFPTASDTYSSPLFNSAPSDSGSGSIFHQSVHIATPAPSPPPSPMGSNGKVAKKQNYQTSPHFPFMYPPLDNSSNDIGGKGSTGMQDILVGRKWQGGNVPASIIEAGEIFSSHLRMTRATRQLWEERERFMRYERGWSLDDDGSDSLYGNEGAEEPQGVNPFEDEQSNSTPKVEQTNKSKRKRAPQSNNPEVQRCLDAVEDVYRQALPHLQSVVIVLLKEILANITEAIAQSEGGGQMGSMFDEPESEELNFVRWREITTKAISAVLFLMTKWFKRSHVLKFEYMTQLLLDSNYLPLILKMFLHQDVDLAVAQNNDREELNFFYFCQIHSDQPPEERPRQQRPPLSAESEDGAIPPPVLRRSRTQAKIFQINQPRGRQMNIEAENVRPEVDELGNPTSEAPPNLVKPCSFRNFFSAINFLRVMQKITKKKAHRCLLLVQYKSSAILRKGMKVPDPHLRLYTLKLFKSQVPYSSRKWRQSHMRVITAIYLYCRPELRDDWLTGGDIDGDVEEALPMEQALRGLTHWWHLRAYKDVLVIKPDSALSDERDFFVRELEKMGWGMVGDEAFNEEEIGGPDKCASM